MQVERIPFKDVPQFSTRDKAYVLADSKLRPFYEHPVQLEQFAAVMEARDQSQPDRALLHRVLTKQYAQLAEQSVSLEQIEKLKDEHTYTVVTAHQPSLFTGPLYFVYKLFSCINLAKQLQKAHPGKHVVPVFILGGEDHDFEEINHLHLFGKRLEWQQDKAGAVGRLPSSSLVPVLEELRKILGDSNQATELHEILERSFRQHTTYGKGMQALLHELFADRGLLVFSMDDAELKRAFVPLMKREIFEQASKDLVESTQKALEEIGLSAQAHARDINFFYLEEGARRRLVEEDGVYRVLDSDIYFTPETLLLEMEYHPERFSPNVIMRPIYQELILPNLAYIGGGGELAYWLERKSQFRAFQIPFPMLIRRNSALWVDSGSVRKLEKLNLKVPDLLDDTDHIIRYFVEREAAEPLDLEEEKKFLQELFERIARHAEDVDPTLVGYVGSEGVKQLKSLEQIEGRLMRAEKQKHETAIKQLRSLKDKLFPSNGLQERQENFMGIYLKHGQTFFDLLEAELNPLETDFLIFKEQE